MYKHWVHFKVWLVVFTLLSLFSFSQRGYKVEFGMMTGLSNYLGEMGGRQKAARGFLWDTKIAKTRWSESPYFRYKFHPMLAARFSFNYLRISGDDKLSTNVGRRYRNLSFRNDIFDVESVLQWMFYSSSKPTGIYRRANVYLTGYLLAGIGGFYHNPKTLYQGSWIALQPVKTEGVNYSKFGFCVPIGLGFYATINKRRRAHRIGVEFNWRYTNTDYLDDVSTTYKSPAELPSATAVALSNRNPELTKQPDGVAGNYGWQGLNIDGSPKNKAPRGNPNNKDSYYSVNFYYGIAIKSRFTKSRGRKIRSVTF